jgi:2-keto-4-pentenoate hydratase
LSAGEIDPRLVAALKAQLHDWQATLRGGSARVGWKLGVGERESIGGEAAIGHLTSATLLSPGSTYPASRSADLHADAEVALELRREVPPDADANAARGAIARFGVALEIVDLSGPANDAESIVAANVFHRAVAFGPWRIGSPGAGVEATLIVDGEVQASARATGDFAQKLTTAARLLAAVDQRLQAGDRIITGSIVQIPIKPGNDIIADLRPLGRVQLSIA